MVDGHGIVEDFRVRGEMLVRAHVNTNWFRGPVTTAMITTSTSSVAPPKIRTEGDESVNKEEGDYSNGD